MNGRAQCVFQFLTSLLISSGQIVQYLTLIYFYGGVSPLVCLRRRRGETTRGGGESEKVSSLPRIAC